MVRAVAEDEGEGTAGYGDGRWKDGAPHATLCFFRSESAGFLWLHVRLVVERMETQMNARVRPAHVRFAVRFRTETKTKINLLVQTDEVLNAQVRKEINN